MTDRWVDLEPPGEDGVTKQVNLRDGATRFHRGSTGGVSGALTGARGDTPGSLPDDGHWPPSNSAQGAVVRARLARLRWALVDEHTALARLHRDYGGEAVPHDGPGQCPVTDLDLKVLRQACTVLERLIQNK